MMVGMDISEERRARPSRSPMLSMNEARTSDSKGASVVQNGWFICTSIYVTPIALDSNKRIASDRADHPLID